MANKLQKSQLQKAQKHFRAIIFDVDGTLVRHDPLALPTPRVSEAIRRAQDSGCIVSAATGRLLNGFEKINKSLRFTVPVVLEGGARLYDPIKKKDIWVAHLDARDAQEIAENWHHKGLPFGFSAGNMQYNSASLIAVKKADIEHLSREGKEWTTNQLEGRIEITDRIFQEIDFSRITHFISFPLQFEKAEELKKSLRHLSHLSVSVNGTHYENGWCVYVTHAAATKQHGILEFAKHCEISPREIIGVGDQELDYPLLMACGFKVAMGNAVQALKDIADYVAPSVEEDGAAEVIEKFLL